MGKNARLKRERSLAHKGSQNTSSTSAVQGIAADGSASFDTPPSQPPHPTLPILVLHIALLTLLTLSSSIFPIESEDIFSNIVTGKYLWTTGSIPETDPFSFTGPHRWLVNRAFPSIVFYGVHSIGGLPAIQLFCAALLSLIYALLYVVWARRTRRPILSFAVIAVLILASCYWAQTRIYVFAYLYTVAAILLVTSPSPRAIWWAVPLQIAWINSHPSAILGIFIVGLWFAATAWSKTRSLRESSLVLTLVIVANALSPIGLRAFVKFAEEAFGSHPSRANIFEWLSPFSPTVSGQHLALWFFGSCVVLVIVLGRQFLRPYRLRSALILIPLTCAFFILAAGCARHIPLFYFAFSSLLICVGEALLDHRGSPNPAGRARVLHSALCLVVLAVSTKIFLYGYANGNADRRFAFGIDTHKFPDRAIDIVRRNRIEGNVITDYDTGAYFLYRMYPDYKVYIDGARLDEVYGEEGFLRYMKLGNDQHVIDEEIVKYDVRAFIIPLPPSKDEIVQLHKFLSSDPQWGLAYFDDTSMLFIKRDEAARRGVPVFSYLSPFTGADEIIKSKSDGVAALERDFELGESINPNSVAFLTMKTRFLKARGQKDLAAQNARRMVNLCKEIDPSKICRDNAQRQLMGMGQFGLARELQ